MYPEVSGHCKTDRMFFPTKKAAVIGPETGAGHQRGMTSLFSSAFRKSPCWQASVCALMVFSESPSGKVGLCRLGKNVASCERPDDLDKWWRSGCG